MNLRFKALAEMIRSFQETDLLSNFRMNLFHSALYQWYILENHNIPNPGRHPYMTEEVLKLIKEVKDEGLLNLSNMKTGTWYRVLLEDKVTMQTDLNGRRSLIPCRAELKHPDADWESIWALANLKGLNSVEHTFLWRMLHDLLPTQARLFRLQMRNTPNSNCNLCDVVVPADLKHSLLTCPYNSEVTDWLMRVLLVHLPGVQPHQVVLLDLGQPEEDLQLPLVWLIAKTLSLEWDSRKEKEETRPS